MEEIIITPNLELKLDRLIVILFEKEYFGFKSSSQNYVDKIVTFIYNIPNVKHHKAKKDKYGKWYAIYKPNKGRTAYYITFNKKDNRYVIKDIFTNHVKEYSAAIKGLK